MNTQCFEQWQDQALTDGQHALSNALRELLYRVHPDAFATLDFDDDNVFLQPQLFAHFTLHGPLAKLRDTTPQQAASLAVQQGQLAQTPNWSCSGQIPAVYARLFTGSGHALPRALQAEAAYRHHRQVRSAQHWLRRYCPRIAHRLQACTRQIYLFRATLPHSFAPMSAHGTVFLNVPEEADEVFFLEDMVRQCAHVAFHAMTHDKQRYLSADPHRSLGDLLKDAADQRSLYSVFHALYTYVVIAEVLSAMLKSGELDERQSHEARGRLAYNLLKFRIDLQRMRKPGFYTAKGLLLYKRFAACCARHTLRDARLVEGLDLSNQPCHFSYAHFVQCNPFEELQLGVA
jgi:hypothetical protein